LLGLTVFIAVVGILSGPTFIGGLKEAGISIFFWGIFATLVPMLGYAVPCAFSCMVLTLGGLFIVFLVR